jgi:hypothetical protein
MRTRLLTIVLIAGLILTNAAWAYLLLDRSVSIDHCRSELGYSAETIELLTSLVRTVPRDGQDREIYEELSVRYPDEIVKNPEPGLIEIGGVILEYRDGILVEVREM